MQHAAGKVIFVLGPSGSGKGELMRAALSAYPELYFPVSETTRAMRPGEADGREYRFVTRESFERDRDDGLFLEWAEYGGNYYGTPKRELLDPLAAGRTILHEIELQGLLQLETMIPQDERVSVYIDAGPWEALEARIRARAPITEEELAKRKARYEHELAFKSHADIVVRNQNGDLRASKREFVELVGTMIQRLEPVS